MSHALAVSAFPETNPPQRYQATAARATCLVLDTSAKRIGVEPVTVLNPGSVEQSSKSAQLSDDDLESPTSPMIFRTVDEPGRYLDHDVDRSLPPISTSALTSGLAAWHSGAQQHAVSTKASIAALGLSRHSPTPSYDLLSTSSWLNPRRDHLDQHIPPRSSSLPSSHCISICGSSHTMSRSPTPSSVDSDRCSAMVFAEPSPQEAEYGSAPKLSLRTSSLGPDSSSQASSSSQPSRSASSLSQYSSGSTSRTYDGPYGYDPTPYSLMGAVPGFAFNFMPPRLPKTKPRAKAAASDASVAPSADSSLRSGFKRMKRLATRRSISSFDFLSSADAAAAPSASSAQQQQPYPADRGQSSESVASTVVSTPSDDEQDTGRMVAHKVVGDVWEPQDLNAVIPALRSLKVSGRIKH